jgi:ribosomal protein S18 acetylase RimI-like enzyme
MRDAEPPLNYKLRPAVDSDREFLYELHRTTMYGYIETTWGWDETWQRHEFDRRFREQIVSVIETADGDVGALWLETRPDSVYIEEIQIMPASQRRGIGTAVLTHLIAESAGRGVAVELAVLPGNEDARRLYDRLGFKVTKMEEPFVYMRIEPNRGSQFAVRSSSGDSPTISSETGRGCR